ncbi:MAG TPA: hypothetical protein VFY20_13150 [Gemmatimonadales bacterium]|nr:hypothetical protein [Gemmatimonadales bacterium]
MVNVRRGVTAVIAAAGVLLAACGGDDDGNEPNGTALSSTEAAALSAAIANSGAIAGEASLVAPLAFGLVRSYGTISTTAALTAAGSSAARMNLLAASYDAVGYQVKYDFTVNGVQQVISTTGAVAWAGLDTQAQTVDELVFIAAFDETGDFPTSGNGVIGDDTEATWVVNETESVYLGTSGSAVLESASFSGGTTSCSRDIPGFGTINCSYRYGQMVGSFGFDAVQFQGTGPETVTFPDSDYTLPAVQVVLSADITLPTARAEALVKSLRAMADRQ